MASSHVQATRIFLLGGLMIFCAGLFFIGSRQKLFSHSFEVYTELDRLSGLQTGAKVRVSGMEAGEVLETQVPKSSSGRFRLKLRIQQNLHVFVRRDSVAMIKTTGLAGSSFLDIQKGTPGTPESAPGDTIPSQEPFDIADLLQQGSDFLKTARASIDDLRANADRTLGSLNSAAHRADQAIADLNPKLQEIADSASKSLMDLSETMAQIRQGQGTISKLLTDPKLASDIDQIVNDARQSSLNLSSATARMNDAMGDFQKRDLLGRTEAVLENSRQLTEQLNQAVTRFTSGSVGDENLAADLRDTIAGARTTMTNLAADTEALKNNFLLRGFFKRRGYFNLNKMTPGQYRSDKFLKEHTSQRVWLSQNELFSSGPGGEEKLTKEGESLIDRTMSPLVPYLPNNPMVVEGYSTESSQSERFVRSKQRASAVKSYINRRFGLQPDMVGVMPMPDAIPAIIGKSAWDGVSLVLIR